MYLGFATYFICPIVGVVLYAAFLVCGNLITFHNPFDRFPINHIFVCFFWNVGNDNLAVVNDGVLLLLGKHLLHLEIAELSRSFTPLWAISS